MVLTVAHFERRLDGQIAFGIDLDRETDFFGRYLREHSTDYPDRDLTNYIAGLRRGSITASAWALKEALNVRIEEKLNGR